MDREAQTSMSMAGYTKLFNSILGSTIWRESKETKILWITMLAMAERTGKAICTVPGLAAFAGLTIEETERGLSDLLSPDKYSRTKEHGGRRIEVVDGGWLLLNHSKYRAMMSADERREYKRAKQAEYRDRDRKNPRMSTKSTRGQSGHKVSVSVNPQLSVDSPQEKEPDIEALDRIDADLAFEEKRFTQLALSAGRDGIQAVLDSLPRPASRSPFSATHWLRTGLTGVSRSENALTVLRLTCDALEARQRAKDAPLVSEKNRASFDSIDRVLGTGEYAGDAKATAIPGRTK